jgi:cobalt/nickel transport system permease protein
MALPAVICFVCFKKLIRDQKAWVSLLSAFLCGFLSVLLGSLLAAFALVFTGESFLVAAKLIVVAHLPIMVIEGVITAACIKFLKKVRPELLEVVNGKT